jgi:hypothetical protein
MSVGGMSRIDYRKRLDELLEFNSRASTFYLMERFAESLSGFLKSNSGRFTVTSDFTGNIEVWSGLLDEDDDPKLRIYVGTTTQFSNLRNRGVCARTCTRIDFCVWPVIRYSLACRISYTALCVPLEDVPLLINYDHAAVKSVVKLRLSEGSENIDAIRNVSLVEQPSAIVIRRTGKRMFFTKVCCDPGFEDAVIGFAPKTLLGWSPIVNHIVHPRAAGGFYLSCKPAPA